MRLWHYKLIPSLPRQQLLGQWKECCMIVGNIAKHGSPRHGLVNKVMNYDPNILLDYIVLVKEEMLNRGYNPKQSVYDSLVNKLDQSRWFFSIKQGKTMFEGWHNDRYLVQCFKNLEEKFDCGLIKVEEWKKIVDNFNIGCAVEVKR